ncbi:PulJ/GspJ family protein [Shewanella aestuarii]|uniref:Prepilin-type N-terminal cleavage/methylation domain-containing protein n=1 Tax=Shewanella aestuarii TaxID=1028752 RepID=A0A6G9QKU0_9GAMM|nr:prepilin-type N-terminal cleavage/methylation domain-containing protein [Shewanella aestuarii]QIR15146.1 hypothetical protein HBH39_12160 [Shewanella aestuarii]
MKNRQSGFTLLEVLLASFILFIVLSAMTMVYRGALNSSRVAERSIQIHQVVGLIKTDIQKQFDSGPSLSEEGYSGQGSIDQIKYHWKAEKLAESKGQIILGPDGDFIRPDTLYQNWGIALTLQMGNFQKVFNYRLFRWQEK